MALHAPPQNLRRRAGAPPAGFLRSLPGAGAVVLLAALLVPGPNSGAALAAERLDDRALDRVTAGAAARDVATAGARLVARAEARAATEGPAVLTRTETTAFVERRRMRTVSLRRAGGGRTLATEGAERDVEIAFGHAAARAFGDGATAECTVDLSFSGPPTVLTRQALTQSGPGVAQCACVGFGTRIATP